MLKACLDSAVEERLILRNPAEGCKLPKAEKKEMKVLTQEQLGSYLAAATRSLRFFRPWRRSDRSPSPVTGGMYHPDSVVKLHQKLLKDAGLEHIF